MNSKAERNLELRLRLVELRSLNRNPNRNQNQNLKEYRICTEDVEVGGGADWPRRLWAVDFPGAAEEVDGAGFLVRAKFA
jgi:hypothetical protein